MYSIIDIESNGGAFREEHIIEIAIYRFDGHQVTDQFSSIINPESSISPFVQKLTGITPKMVRTAPKFHEVAKRIIEITNGTTLVGHNVAFDYRMLRQSFKRLGYDFQIDTIDTLPLAKKMIPDEESYSLGKLAKSLGFPITNWHRAAGDARATLDLFKLLLTKDKDAEIIQSHQTESSPKGYAQKIDLLTEALPASKGIVYFQSFEGKILFYNYVEDIYKSAKKILTSKSPRWKKVQKYTEHIAYERVGTEIFAQLIMSTKGLSARYKLFYGLFFRNGSWQIERATTGALVCFRTLSQGKKVLDYVELMGYSVEDLRDKMQAEQLSGLLVGEGRTRGEKAFILMVQGKIQGYGFYDLYHQVSTYSKIDKLKISVGKLPKSIYNELKLSLLKNEFKVQPLPH